MTPPLPPLPDSHTGLLLEAAQVLQEVLHVCQAAANVGEGGCLLGHGIQGSFDLRQRKADLEHLCLIQERKRWDPRQQRADGGQQGSAKVLRPADRPTILTA